jgi:hypothetical protein
MHPLDLEIAALIDDRLNPAEREKILSHIDGCEECFEVYAGVLKFKESERERKKKVWLPLAAAFLIGALLLPLILQKLQRTSDDFSWPNPPQEQALNHIKENISKMEDEASYGFSPGLTRKSVRLGILIEDVRRLIASPDLRLQKDTLRLLMNEAKPLFESETSPADTDVKEPVEKIVTALDRHIRERLKLESKQDSYYLGKYIERSIFLCMDGKFPDLKQIDRLKKISEQNQLAEIVPRLLERILNETTLNPILEHLKAIRDIFI